MKKVMALGEMLIDFVPETNGLPLDEVPSFKKAPGGAPANVAAAVARLGGSASFVGKVGRDHFGLFLKNTLQDIGVDTQHMLQTDEAKTALAFVSLKQDGERDFLFYRDPSADMLLREEEIDAAMFNDVSIYHFGSISLISDPSRNATVKGAKLAREKGVLVSYDPNLRLALWKDAEEAKRVIMEHVSLADMVKVSEEELEFLTGETDPLAGADFFLNKGVRLLLVTYGKEGSVYVWDGEARKVEGRAVQAVDTTGAGDGFTGGILYQMARAGNTVEEMFGTLTFERLDSIVRFANTVGALTTTKRGAISALPTLEEVTSRLGSL
ncbi:PfkB family carbohydrate kinase [Aneurinibacillus terranovensis]|uniref:PfkB family carbohydrate kinase n=1 Tax=Aneurinibacillus terranovensis TaxID=278991 RepID=UPI00041B641E|nr:PfkB family carbohydrate kinase [Aneurinibacillus terranovensis]